jgi:hypothetical protein
MNNKHTRRSFLKQAGLLGAGLAISSEGALTISVGRIKGGMIPVPSPLRERKSGNNPLISDSDFQFFERLTKDVLESSRIYPGQFISETFGKNNTGGTLIRPGGRNTYPSFWIRDYTMSLECGFITAEEQKHMLHLTAATQCDQTWITKGGSMIPRGSVADHIRIDNSLPIYFPGTYSYEDQGIPRWGVLPPISDQFFFIHMAHQFMKASSDADFLFEKINGISLLNRLEMAFNLPATRNDSPVVCTTDKLRAVDFGFRDTIIITGDLCYPSILKYRAANELAELLEKTGYKRKAEEYRSLAQTLKKAVARIFFRDGMLLASTGYSGQPDVWATALAVYLGVLDGEVADSVCHKLTNAYKEGTLSHKGNIRHVLTSDDYSEDTAWEKTTVKKNTYQNGAFWGTPTGWVAFAISRVDVDAARKLVAEFVEDLRENDYRKGEKYGAPWECIFPPDYQQNPVYLTTVACPYIVFKNF